MASEETDHTWANYHHGGMRDHAGQTCHACEEDLNQFAKLLLCYFVKLNMDMDF